MCKEGWCEACNPEKYDKRIKIGFCYYLLQKQVRGRVLRQDEIEYLRKNLKVTTDEPFPVNNTSRINFRVQENEKEASY
jgi:hypothetical protein